MRILNLRYVTNCLLIDLYNLSTNLNSNFRNHLQKTDFAILIFLFLNFYCYYITLKHLVYTTANNIFYLVKDSQIHSFRVNSWV